VAAADAVIFINAQSGSKMELLADEVPGWVKAIYTR
jgi:hypothetical protein